MANRWSRVVVCLAGFGVAGIVGLAGCGDDDDEDDDARETAQETGEETSDETGGDTGGETGDETGEETGGDETGEETGGDTGEETGDETPMLATRTTLTRRLTAEAPSGADSGLNPSSRRGLSEYLKRGFDQYDEAAGEGHLLRLPPEVAGREDGGERKSLSLFAHLSDIHIVDDESPMRLCSFDTPFVAGGLRPQEAFAPHAFDAMVATINAWQARTGRVDFALFTGDLTDNAQENEIRWMIDIADGVGPVWTDSGAKLAEYGRFPQKAPFFPVGFSVPWYVTLGNHDALIVGSFAVSDAYRAVTVGDTVFQGTRDYDTKDGFVVPAGAKVAADAGRKLLTTAEIVAEFFETPTLPGPVGHGFSQRNIDESQANFVVDPVEGLPLRIITLDTNDHKGGSGGRILKATFDAFIVPELERASDEGVMVIVASHHPDRSLKDYAGEFEREADPEYLDPAEFQRALMAYPNVVLRLAGHTHQNRVSRAEPEAGAAGLRGYWQVETASVVEFPQQARFLEFVLNEDDTLSIFATLIDYETTGFALAEEARKLAYVDYRSGWSERTEDPPESRNVELVVALPEGLAAKLRAIERPTKVESLTSFAEPMPAPLGGVARSPR